MKLTFLTSGLQYVTGGDWLSGLFSAFSLGKLVSNMSRSGSNMLNLVWQLYIPSYQRSPNMCCFHSAIFSDLPHWPLCSRGLFHVTQSSPWLFPADSTHLT